MTSVSLIAAQYQHHSSLTDFFSIHEFPSFYGLVLPSQPELKDLKPNLNLVTTLTPEHPSSLMETCIPVTLPDSPIYDIGVRAHMIKMCT